MMLIEAVVRSSWTHTGRAPAELGSAHHTIYIDIQVYEVPVRARKYCPVSIFRGLL